jgi:hypothetical protein
VIDPAWAVDEPSRFWAFQGIEAGIYVVLVRCARPALLGVTFWALKRSGA